MQINVNGKVYTATFKHQKENVPVDAENTSLGLREQRSTICQIYEGEFTKEESKAPVSTGKSVCGKKDEFCKETGRKIAFQRALIGYNPKHKPDGAKRFMPREDAEQVWNHILTNDVVLA